MWFFGAKKAEVKPKVKHIYHKRVSRIPHEELAFKKFKGARLSYLELPESVDLRSKMSPPYDQGQLGSCTANALCGLFQYDDPTFMGSRLFLYYNERDIENNVSEDAGAELYDGIKSLKQCGVCSESLWSYDISKFADKPPQECYDEALKHEALVVSNIQQDVNTMKNCLTQGFPFCVGIAVYDSFESEEVAKTGIIPMPSSNSQQLGGHAISIFGYTKINGQNYWIMRNSWGTSWGDKGYGYLPFEYLLDSNLSSDLWNITKVEE